MVDIVPPCRTFKGQPVSLVGTPRHKLSCFGKFVPGRGISHPRQPDVPIGRALTGLPHCRMDGGSGHPPNVRKPCNRSRSSRSRRWSAPRHFTTIRFRSAGGETSAPRHPHHAATAILGCRYETIGSAGPSIPRSDHRARSGGVPGESERNPPRPRVLYKAWHFDESMAGNGRPDRPPDEAVSCAGP